MCRPHAKSLYIMVCTSITSYSRWGHHTSYERGFIELPYEPITWILTIQIGPKKPKSLFKCPAPRTGCIFELDLCLTNEAIMAMMLSLEQGARPFHSPLLTFGLPLLLSSGKSSTGPSFGHSWCEVCEIPFSTWDERGSLRNFCILDPSAPLLSH